MNNSFNDFLDYATSRLDYLDSLNKYIEKSAGYGPELINIARRTASEAGKKNLAANVAKWENKIETRVLGRPEGGGGYTVSEKQPLSKSPEDIKHGIEQETAALDNSISALERVIKNAPKEQKQILKQELNTYKKLKDDIASGTVPVSGRFAVPEPGIHAKVREAGYEPSGYGDVLWDAADRFDRAINSARKSGLRDSTEHLAERLFINEVAKPIHDFAKLNPDYYGTRMAPVSGPRDGSAFYRNLNPDYAHYLGLSELFGRANTSGNRDLAKMYRSLMDNSAWGVAEAKGLDAITELLNKGKKPIKAPLNTSSGNNSVVDILNKEMAENEMLFREGMRSRAMYEVMKAKYQREISRATPGSAGNIESEIRHLDLLRQRGAIRDKDYKAQRAELDARLNEAKVKEKYDITPEEARPTPEEVAPTPAPEEVAPTPAPTEATPPTTPKPLETAPSPTPAEAPVPGGDPLPVNTKEAPTAPVLDAKTRMEIDYYRGAIAEMQKRISELNVLLGREGPGDIAAQARNEMALLQNEIRKHEARILKLSEGTSVPPTGTSAPATEPLPPPTRPSEPIPPAESGGPVPPTKTDGPVPPTTPDGPVPSTTPDGPVPPTKTDGPVPPSESGGPVPEPTPEVKPPFSSGTAAAVLAALGIGGTAAYNLWPGGDDGSGLGEGGSISPQVREIINNVANADSAELVAARDEIARLRNRPDMSQMSFLERLLFLIFGQHYLDILGGLTK